MNRKTVIVIGALLLVIMAFFWTQEMSVVSGEYWMGTYPPERAVQLRADINQKYFIWFVIAAAGTVALSAVVDTDNKENQPRTDKSNDVRQ